MVKLLRTRTAKLTQKTPTVRFRMRITVGEQVAIGPGKIELLEAIREHGSISAAARAMDMSYRRAWVLLDETNRSLKTPATTAAQGGQQGGGTALTPTGEKIVALYRAIEQNAAQANAAPLGTLRRLLAKPA